MFVQLFREGDAICSHTIQTECGAAEAAGGGTLCGTPQVGSKCEEILFEAENIQVFFLLLVFFFFRLISIKAILLENFAKDCQNGSQ
jgi:hypothetical protein